MQTLEPAHFFSCTGGFQPNKGNTEVTVFHQGVLQCKERLGLTENNRAGFTLKETPPNS